MLAARVPAAGLTAVQGAGRDEARERVLVALQLLEGCRRALEAGEAPHRLPGGSRRSGRRRAGGRAGGGGPRLVQAGEGGAAAEAVKAGIKELIDAETEILSDDAIAALLKQRGFEVARRTVVKYREAMGIGSSIQRRRLRKIAG